MSKHLSKTYQKKTDIQHILDAPDTYIGQVDEDDIKNWILSGDEYNEKSINWLEPRGALPRPRAARR